MLNAVQKSADLWKEIKQLYKSLSQKIIYVIRNKKRTGSGIPC